jgi:hypothetical protein
MTRYTTMPARGVLLAILFPMLAFSAGCGKSLFSGSLFGGSHQTRTDVYKHVMTPLQLAKYEQLESAGKPVSILLAYLQEIGVYQQWAEQPIDMQEAILRRQVLEGMTPLQVQMAWGLPEEKRDDTSPAERAEGHTKKIWDYGYQTQKVGGSTYDRSVCFYDDRVLWVRQPR